MPSLLLQKSSTFARRLREVRLRSELPQDKLGVLAGLEESSASARMSRYENGIHEPSHKFVESIAKVLGISTAYFYCGDDRLAAIILAYSELPEHKRQALRQYATELQ
ncbi:helix-turn-helix domain-containing protein [Massilia sp. CCM 8695]|uniref:Helix-turn-helix domain-containing protein n=1 Tax=Massilia frigida TaxID=2609281 RepID=A0ABX0MYC6_9BURK|nr:helix-turn-helix transcriptional regulator [Massilia frigida]NHZ78047.1 helix-turn-helix domain-containing protein [Massilia frigida]